MVIAIGTIFVIQPTIDGLDETVALKLEATKF
jgi:hypothetical protein